MNIEKQSVIVRSNPNPSYRITIELGWVYKTLLLAIPNER